MAHTHLHTLVVRGHEVSCCDPVIVQHSIGHDAIALDLDAEWEDLFITVAFEKPDGEIYEVAYDGEPVEVPASATEEARWLPVGISGHVAEGDKLVLTAGSDRLLKVVPSGPVSDGGSVEDPPDVLGQLLAARDEALAAAERAEEAAETAENVKRGTQVSVTDGRPLIGGIEGDSAIDPTTGQFWEFVDDGTSASE